MLLLPTTARLRESARGHRPEPRAAAGGFAAVLLMVVGASAPAASAAPGQLVPAGSRTTVTANPPGSIRPSAAFTRYCFIPGHTAACNQAALADINGALRSEHHADLALPTTFWSANPLRQLKVIVNEERHLRGLPILTLSVPLNAPAQSGAERGADPTGPAGRTWGSNLASGYETPLAADFGWMYDDGPGSPNSACTAPGAPACWGHRDNILVPWHGSEGAGAAVRDGRQQLTELFVKNA